jgi:hypothetical protein
MGALGWGPLPVARRAFGRALWAAPATALLLLRALWWGLLGALSVAGYVAIKLGDRIGGGVGGSTERSV